MSSSHEKHNDFNAMAWTKPEYPHHQVDNAGDILIAPDSPDFSLDEAQKFERALTIINNWRSSHGCPLQSIKMTLLGRAKKIDIQSLIAQRIKRIRAISVKLRRNPKMKLSKMHDIGGCRAVTRTVTQVEALVKNYERATAKNKLRGGEFVKKYDYIQNPKPDGYRGVHLVYKYRSESKALAEFNGLRIEIQIRSRLQHYWATAVETVDAFTGQALKSNFGEDSWKSFFSLVASAVARFEKRPIVPGTPSDPEELKRQLKLHSEQIDLLEGLRTATGEIEKKAGHFFILVLNSKERKFSTLRFQQNQLNEAQNQYLELEKTNKDKPEVQTVLVSVDSVEHLRKAYPNYFLDINEFV
ncbi:MAG TPA: RelA/SpoT domain-containing protein, partial [Verrucomicrobiae bacterium]|nr:RelA/SpoT domain-containing protein [Verrucomicrobiae bacterium]